MKNAILGLNVDNMSLESKRLYCVIKLVSQMRPKSKDELLEAYDKAVDELTAEYHKTGNPRAFRLADELLDMKNFIDEHLEDVSLDGLEQVDWSDKNEKA